MGTLCWARMQCYLGTVGKEAWRRGGQALVSLRSWVPGLTSSSSSPSPSCSASASRFGQAAATSRGLHFDVEDNSQVDHVFKKMNRKLNMEGVLLEARIRTWHTKKSDQKIIDQRRTAKRLARKAVGRKINWIMKKRERG